jgi:hypothetical protein
MVIAEAKYEMHTLLMASTCTLLFFTFFSFLRKYLHVHRNRTLQIQDKPPFSRLEIHTKCRNEALPELALGADLVGGPKVHAVDHGMLIAGHRQCTTHHLVLMELHKRDHRGINQGLTASTKSKGMRFLTNCTNTTVVAARRLVSGGGGGDRI